MKFSRIAFVILFAFYLISCKNGVDKKSNTEQEKNTVPSTEYQKTEKSFPKLDRQKPVEKRLDKEVKKEKLKAMDTLKPVKAIP